MFYLDIQSDESLIGKCIGKEIPNCKIILGKAGTGKSYNIRNRSINDPSYCLLTAPTGIAAINLDSVTTNSALGYYNTDSLLWLYKNSKLHDKLEYIRQHYKNLGIDEMSMLGAKKLDIIIEAISEVNAGKKKKLGLILLGDFCQLPPVKEDYAFEGNSWPLIARDDNIQKREKIYRQDNLEFIQALSLIRQGKGHCAIAILDKLGIPFTTKLNENFGGTTIMGMNEMIKDFNAQRFNKILNPIIRVSPIRRGTQLKEWDDNIPIEMRFKETCYVTILANDTETWQYANGDVGWVVKYVKANNSTNDNDYFIVKLKRNDREVKVPRIIRYVYTINEPPQKAYTSMYKPYFDRQTQQWVIGSIKYHPIKLAYGSTVQKSQGLSLDRAQIDIRAYNFNYPNMIYVAMSRVKNPKELIIVGTKNDFVNKTKVDPKVLRWI
jgi:ATP-dependent exoDNAse (exonuclease V) alpha subunit